MTPNIDNKEMRDYLLGILEAERRTALEEGILGDPDLYEQLLIIEVELIDQYVAGGLSSLEKHQFETHFLITAERQKNLRFGRLLKRYLNAHPSLGQHQNAAASPIGKTTPVKNPVPFYLTLGKATALAISAAVVLCLGIVFCCWLVARRPAEPTVQYNSSRLVVVTLLPGSTTSTVATKRVAVPPDGVDVKLELELVNTSFHNYKSELFRESQPLERRAELKIETRGDQHIVPLMITGGMLSPGDYQVKLSGVLDSGQDEFINSYSFRVTTE